MRLFGVNPGEQPDYVIVGLGNPGAKYENTRHNIGFKLADYIDSKSMMSRGCKRMLHYALTDKCVLGGTVVYIMKPQTFMNNSGMAVQDLMSYYGISPKNLIVIHDDITLDSGKFKIKFGGSAGGHNGIKSVMEHLGTGDFIRIKVGVGKKPKEWDLASYVISRFPEDEYKLVSSRFEDIKDAVECILGYGLEKAMCIYNPLGSNKI